MNSPETATGGTQPAEMAPRLRGDLTAEDATVSITRKQLYERVWKESLAHVGPTLGIWPTRLGKICVKNNIPLTAVLHDGAVVLIFPKCARTGFPPVVLARHGAGSQLHHTPHRFRLIHMDDQVDMAGGDTVPVHIHAIAMYSEPQPLPVRIPIPCKPEQKFAILAPVR